MRVINRTVRKLSTGLAGLFSPGWLVHNVLVPVLFRLPTREQEILKESLAYWLEPTAVSTYGAAGKGRTFSHLVAWEMATDSDLTGLNTSVVLELYGEDEG